MNKNLILVDRSRSTTDWTCGRKRWLNYELDGTGIVPANDALQLMMGTIIHDSLAAVATATLDATASSSSPFTKIDIDGIAELAFKQMFAFLSIGLDSNSDDAKWLYAKEQATLVEGMIRAFYKYQWPRLMEQYPKILAVEQEMPYEYGQILWMAKPDLVVADTHGDVVYIEYKSTSSKREEWVNSWGTAVQLHATTRAIEACLNEEISHVVVQGIYKGYECLVPETPVLTANLQWVKVGSLKTGDKLAGFEENSGNNRSGGKSLRAWKEAEIIAVGRKKLPCYELILEDGTKFVCSVNHLWLTARKDQGMGSGIWKTTEELKPNVSRILKVIEPWEGLGEFSEYDAGYIAAALDGEGNLSNMQFDSNGTQYSSLGLHFTQKPNVMMDTVKGILSSYGIKFGEYIGKDGDVNRLQMYGKTKVLSLLGKVRPKRLLEKLNFNSLGMIKDLPERPVKVISKKFVGEMEVVTLGTSTETLIANGFASHNSYGKQSSPFCYAYRRSGTPPFSRDEIGYEYKAGFKRFPTWEISGGVKEWVAGMPDSVLANQFPQTPPIFVNDDMVEDFFAQRNLREIEISLAKGMLAFADAEAKQAILNLTFPQKFDQCSPSYGRGCPYKRVCFGEVTDPLNQGFIKRVPHHAIEAAAQAAKE